MNAHLPDDLMAHLKSVKAAWTELRQLSTSQKNAVLIQLADTLVSNSERILIANREDVKNCAHEPAAYVDRLTLSRERIASMAASLKAVAALSDPVGEVVEEKTLANGLQLKRMRAPLGVIFMIYESRPNVAVEAFSMAFKSGNAIILRGGRESEKSVAVIYSLIADSLRACEISTHSFWGITNYDRQIVDLLLKQKDYIDIVIPRGGEKLIAHVQTEALMPIIKNDRGLCHTYIHEDADLMMAQKIVVNAKTSRPSVCNSLETVLVHEKLAAQFLPSLAHGLSSFQMQFFGCEKSLAIFSGVKENSNLHTQLTLADDSNFNTEYLDFKINMKVVRNFEEALAHIERFGSKHSEAIVTSDETVARKFQNQVDAAVVYWNASTRFTDGFEMGLGGEIGISTQKLHVRGPVGLRELTTPRWVVDGNGQIR